MGAASQTLAGDNLLVVDLSDLVVALLPSDGFATMDWDYMADDPRIAWKTDGYDVSGGATIREGLALVIANGKTSKILHQKWEDLPWTVTLKTDANPRQGPRMIEITPGGRDPASICFGSRFLGCEFPESAALASKALFYRRLCGFSFAGNGKQVYAISAIGKKQSLLVY